MKSKRERIGRKIVRFAVFVVLAATAAGVVAEASDYGPSARVAAFRTAADLVSLSRVGSTDPYGAAGYNRLVSPTQSRIAHIDWAAHNSDAGGSVDCPAQYIENGIEYAIVTGGRFTVIDQALFEVYDQHFDTAFNLVPMTQCHNPGSGSNFPDSRFWSRRPGPSATELPAKAIVHPLSVQAAN
jgi:hypothetical protein